MNEKFLNQTGLAYYHDRAKTIFENKIEGIRLNNTVLTPDTNKVVDIVTPEVTKEGSGANETVYIEVGQTGYSAPTQEGMQAYVGANGGKIDKIKLNGAEQDITNKEVNLNVAEFFVDKDSTGKTKASFSQDDVNDEYMIDFTETNDGLNVTIESRREYLTTDLLNVNVARNTYRTEAQVQAQIDAALAGVTGIEYQRVDSLPTTGEKGIIYLVPNSSTGESIYDEYIWVVVPPGAGEDESHFEKIGTTEVDLSNYWNNTNLTAITTAEIDALFA